MPLRAAAVEVDITPPTLPIEKPGWIVKILADRVDDPIFAKIVVLESGAARIGFVALDVLSIRWPEVDRISEIGSTLGVNLYWKRDDLTGIELSGNKIRKLEFLFADAEASGADTVVTCGGDRQHFSQTCAFTALLQPATGEPSSNHWRPVGFSAPLGDRRARRRVV